MFVRKSWLAVLMMPLLAGLVLAPPAEARKRHKKKKVPPPIEETQATDQTGAPPDPAAGTTLPPAATPPAAPTPAPAAQEEQQPPQESKGKRRRRGQKAAAAQQATTVEAKPVDPAAAPPPPPPPPRPGDDKSGIFMVNLRVGGAIGVSNISDQFVLSPEFGISVLPNKAGYIVFPLQFQFGGSFTTIMVPVGFQYDIPLRVVPGLYLTPRVSLGYAAVIDDLGLGHTVTTSAGVFMPEFGAKYVFRKRWNFGAELFSLPIFFASSTIGSSLVGSGGVAVQYRLMFYAGVNF